VIPHVFLTAAVPVDPAVRARSHRLSEGIITRLLSGFIDTPTGWTQGLDPSRCTDRGERKRVMEVHEVSGVAESGRLVLAVTGEVDLANAGRLEAAATAALKAAEPSGALVLDLAGVSFLDSSGLRTVLLVAGTARAAGVGFSVVPSAAVTRVFELAGVGPEAVDVEE
jgi:anti-sigma B factor antagonist